MEQESDIHRCQECGAEISVPEDSVVGEIITCPDCGGEYEIVKKGEDNLDLKPFKSLV